MTLPPLPGPAWFPDPHVPGRERWWTGTEWSEVTHRSPPRDFDWVPEWTRSMWPAMNKPARLARHVSWGWLLAIPAVGLLFVAPPWGVALLVVAIASELAVVALGIVALRRPRSEGGHGLAIWAVSVPPVFALGTSAVLVGVLVAHPAFR